MFSMYQMYLVLAYVHLHILQDALSLSLICYSYKLPLNYYGPSKSVPYKMLPIFSV